MTMNTCTLLHFSQCDMSANLQIKELTLECVSGQLCSVSCISVTNFFLHTSFKQSPEKALISTVFR